MEAPSLNIRGETKVNTLCGGIVTCFILVLTMVYALNSSVELFNPVKPEIAEAIKTNTNILNSRMLTARETDFKIAFNIINEDTGQSIVDPRYTQLFAYRDYFHDGVIRFDPIGVHVCDDDDYA